MLLFSGSSHPLLVKEIAGHLATEVAPLDLKRFPDGEVSLRVPVSVRGQDVFVVQTIAMDPDRLLMELMVIIDAIKRASSKTITAVVPYYGYCRQDRKDKPREPITAKLVANLLTCAGADHILTMDLHAGQLEGFFDIPVDHLHALPVLAQAFRDNITSKSLVVVAPDIGSVKLAHTYATHMKADFAIIDKQRLTSTEVGVMAVIGDIKGKDVLLADDMCSTAGTLVSAAKACHGKGAARIFALVTHGLFSDSSIKKIEESPIEALFVSNTIPVTDQIARSKKIKSVSISKPFAEGIQHILGLI